MKIIQFFLSLIFLTAIAVLLIAGYFGLIPFLSNLMGANNPKDLGIDYSQKEFKSFTEKTGGQLIIIKKTLTPATSISYSGQLNFDSSFTQEQISARLNYSPWKYMPVNNTQVRINKDGTIEFSGNLLIARLPGFIAREGMGQYSMTDVIKGLDFIKVIKINPPVYIKFKASIENNNLSLNVQKIEIGRFNLPLQKIKVNKTLTSVAESILSKVPGFYAKEVNFSDGKLNFKGTIPEKMKVETEQ